MALGLASVPEETLAAWGNPERAMLYLPIMLALSLLGGGRWSLDHLLRGRRR